MKRRNRRAQSAIEYLVLLGVVTAIVMVSFRTLLPKTRDDSEGYFNKSVRGIYGDRPNANPWFNSYP